MTDDLRARIVSALQLASDRQIGWRGILDCVDLADAVIRELDGGTDAAVPSRWIILTQTHQRNETCDQGCVIHNRTRHHMQFWPLHWRDDRKLFERICPHGIGHPDPDQYPYWRNINETAQGVHGCDGCCSSDSGDAK